MKKFHTILSVLSVGFIIPITIAVSVSVCEISSGAQLRELIQNPLVAAWNTQPQKEGESVQPPDVSAVSAVLIEARSGRILYSKQPEKKIYPASTTKVLTALLAIESACNAEGSEGSDEGINRIVRVSKDAAYVEGSSIYLSPGEEIRLCDLIYGLMLRSGNDAAVAIAEDVAGNTADFMKMMNDRVAALGLKNTHFTTPNGLHDEDHYSTSYDMAMLASEAMKNEYFRQVAASKDYVAERAAEGAYNYFYNKNKVLYQYEGGNGIKIGYTQTAGRCLIASASRNGMELICVVMNAPDWFNDSYKLMDYGFANYDYVKIAEGERILKKVCVSTGDGHGDEKEEYIGIAPKEDIWCPSEKGIPTEISILYDIEEPVKLPVNRWQEAGELKIFSRGEYIYSVPLYYMEDAG